MTEVLAAHTVPAPRSGGGPRRFVLVIASLVVWAAGLVCFGAGLSPSPDQPSDWTVSAALFGLSALLLALPIVAIMLPARRLVRRHVSVVLRVAADHPAPQLPPFESWAGPARMFRRLMVSSYSYTALPLLLLVGSAIAFGLFLGEPGAGVVFAVLALIPLFFTVVTMTLPGRLSDGVRAGLEAGQVVAVRVDSRLDQKMVVGGAFMSWFDAILPDGQHVTLRTPTHFTWAADERGVVDSPELVMVMGRAGHQGLLLLPSRPEDAVWLLGPVPLVRVPRSVQKAFAANVPSR